MSGAVASKRVLNSTVAVATAGAIVFAPLAPLAQEVMAPLDPVAISVGSNSGFTRVEFAGVVGSRAQVRREGRAVVVRIGTTAAPDVARLKVDPPAGVEKVETRAVRGGAELVLTLAEGADARSGVADGAVWLNLYAPGQAPEAPATRTAPARPVPVKARVAGQRLDLDFDWPSPVAAAVFRRGEAVWIVFDSPGRLDMTGARAGALGPVADARWAAGADYVVVRLTAPGATAVSAVEEGGRWTVTLSPDAAPASGVSVGRDDTGEPALVAQVAGATRVVWLTDPLVGDRFAAVPARGPAKGLGERRETVDLTLLPTAQGLAVETARDDLQVQAAGDLVTLSRPGGLALSAPSAALETAAAGHTAPRKAPFPALILPEWSDLGHAGFAARQRELQDAASAEAARAADDPRAPVEARMAYARFLVGMGLSYEAIGVLNALVAQTPSLQGEPEIRGLRGAARAAIGRWTEAEADLASGALAGDPATRVWQGYVAAQRGDWEEARRAFDAGAVAIDKFPQEWRARFGAAHALAAVETGDLPAARVLLEYVFSQQAPATDQLAARLVQARLFELTGETARALNVYKAVARAPLDGIATPAKLGVVRLETARGALKPDQAAAQLEQLKWRWRGDATELSVIRTLGGLYLQQGLYREALTTLRGAGKRIATLPGGVELQADLNAAFRALFLEGGADGLQPIQALGLFYDFRELTPVGAEGDDMVRRLARRLVDVDLLDQAAELLKYQVDNRLEGVAKAQVATDLATVYLMDRQPEAALQALWGSRTTLLPSAVNAERRALEARALMELGRYDHAVETLEGDQTPAARAVRAEIAWKQQNWAAAGGLYEQGLGDRYRDPATALTADEESRLLRAGIAYSLAKDAGALARLSRNYGPFVARARSAPALRVALAGPNGDDADGAVAGLTASADTFAGWVAAMKTQLRERTGGNRAAATPARPGPSAPARNAAA